MIEILQISIQFLIFFIFFLFPVTPFINQLFFKRYNINIYQLLCLNIIINLFLYLIISLFIQNITKLFIINFLISFLFLSFKIRYNFQFLKNSINKTFILFIIINFSLFIMISENPKLNWDGLYQWFPKALTFFEGYGYTYVGNPSYPHLGGFIWSYFWKNSFIEKEYIGRLFYIFFYLSSIFSLTSYINIKKLNKNLSIFILLALISLSFDKFLFTGYQDTLIFSLLLINSCILYEIYNQKIKNNFLYLYYLSSSYICCWIKQEGFIYFLILTCTIVFLKKDIRKIYWLIFITFLILSYFLIKYYLYGEIQFDQKFDILKLKSLNFYMIKEILASLFFNLFKAILEYPLWLVILSTMLFSVLNRDLYKKNYYIFIIFILNFAFIISLVFYSCLNLGMNSCNLIMRVSLDRIMFQSSALYIVWVINVLLMHLNWKKIK